MTDFSRLQAVIYTVKVVICQKWCKIDTLLPYTRTPLSPRTKGNSQPTYNKLVHSAMMHLTTAGVIHKPTIDECVDCTNTLVKTSCGEIL